MDFDAWKNKLDPIRVVTAKALEFYRTLTAGSQRGLPAWTSTVDSHRGFGLERRI